MALTYKPYPTLVKFHHAVSQYTFRYVAGPPGSGKSVGSFAELLAIALRQEPTPPTPDYPKGVRYTRFAVIRSTYPELEETTLQTIKQWLPAKYTRVVMTKPIKIHTVMPLPDGTVADIQFRLIAIGSKEDLGKLDSAEYTAIWLNEMTGLPAELVGKAGERVGRYPPSNMWDDGRNHCTYYGVIGDYNYPNKDHWLVSFLHENKLPEDTILFEQPPALLEFVDDTTGAVSYAINPEAENLVNLDNGEKYLKDLRNYQALNKPDLINTRLLCRYGKAGGDGKPIVTNFDKSRHVAEQSFDSMRLTDTVVSVDTSGIHPCALFWQKVKGQWKIADGLYGDEMGLEEFITDVFDPVVKMRYPGCRILVVCDPANARDSRTKTSPTELFIEYGYDAIVAETNNTDARWQAVETLLQREGRDGVIINPDLGVLVDALDGGYQYKKIRAQGTITEEFAKQAVKNKYSHWADAFQYGAVYIVNSIISEDTKQRARAIATASANRYGNRRRGNRNGARR